MQEHALDILFRFWTDFPPGESETVLFLGARLHKELEHLSPQQLTCVQPFRPWCDSLTAAGIPATGSLQHEGEGFDHVLVLPDRQKDAALSQLAEAFEAVKVGGWVTMSVPNKLGAARYEKLMGTLAGAVESQSKKKCRVFRSQKGEDLDLTLLKQWKDGGAPRQGPVNGLLTQPGVFCWDRLDRGSSALLSLLPRLKGAGVDLGAGIGVLTERALSFETVESVLAIEADYRSIRCMEQSFEGEPRVTTLWADAKTLDLRPRADWVVMNPPFHEGAKADPQIGLAFIRTAHQLLRSRGRLYVVANRKLPYERTLTHHFGKCRTIGERDGFKVIEAIR